MPEVSVIIPNYNHARFLEERISSVLNQTYQNFEVIILDDCSTDHSREIIERYRGHEKIKHIVYNENNSGSPFKQWEKGIRLAKGEWIWIAESDDVATPDFLNHTSKYFRIDVSIIFSRSTPINVKGESVDIGINYPNEAESEKIYDGIDFIRSFMISKNLIPNASAVIFNRNKFSKIEKKYFLKLVLSGDYNTWLQLAAVGKVVFLNYPLNLYRFHESTLRAKKNELSMLLAESPINDKVLRNILKKDYKFNKEYFLYKITIFNKSYRINCIQFLLIGIFAIRKGFFFYAIKHFVSLSIKKVKEGNG